MLELLIALLAFAALAGLSLLALVPPLLLAWVSLALVGFGFLFGVPAGLVYHLVLRRELSLQGKLRAGWYWHPHRQHALLEGQGLVRVTRWFFAGAIGFLVIVTGFTLGVVALLRLR